MFVSCNTPKQWDDLLSNERYLSDYNHMTVKRIELAKAWHKKEMKILNIGSGQGYLENFFKDEIANKTISWTSLDISKEGLKNIKDRFPSINTTLSSALKMPFDDNSFDLIYCMEVLEHIPKFKVSEVYKEISRVATANVIISVPTYERRSLINHPVGHRRKYTPSIFRSEIEANNLEVLKSKLLFAFNKPLDEYKSFVSEKFYFRRPNVVISLCRT